jgi:hypothetical protein
MWQVAGGRLFTCHLPVTTGVNMSSKLLDQFRQQEADNIALSVKFIRWSLVMIEVMIQEQEQKLVANDLPVDVDGEQDNFWEEIA